MVIKDPRNGLAEEFEDVVSHGALVGRLREKRQEIHGIEFLERRSGLGDLAVLRLNLFAQPPERCDVQEAEGAIARAEKLGVLPQKLELGCAINPRPAEQVSDREFKMLVPGRKSVV